jgi:hypothetical protein
MSRGKFTLLAMDTTMTLLRTPTLLLLLVLAAPLAAVAADPAPPTDPPSGTDPAAVPPPAGEDLPYGAGYEARHRHGQGGEQATPEQARSENRSAARERDRTESRPPPADARPARDAAERPAASREARREARGHWGQHGPVRR